MSRSPPDVVGIVIGSEPLDSKSIGSESYIESKSISISGVMDVCTIKILKLIEVFAAQITLRLTQA
jgi:hypothetical protein